MPNETNNRLELTGNEEDIKKFIELHKVTVDDNLWWNFLQNRRRNKKVNVKENQNMSNENKFFVF